MVTSSSNTSSMFPSRSSSASPPESPYHGTLSDVTPLTHDSDFGDWVRTVKSNFRVRGTIAFLEYKEGPGVPTTPKEKAAQELLAENEKKYLLICCLGVKFRKSVLLFPSTNTIWQIWHAIRKEFKGLDVKEQFALLSAFKTLDDEAYPSTGDFLEAIDERWEHLVGHLASIPYSSSTKLEIALSGIKNHHKILYDGFWNSFPKGNVPTYEDLKDYIETEGENDCDVFDTTKKPQDVEPKSKILHFRDKGKSKSW